MSIQDAIQQRTDHLDKLRKLRKEATEEIERLIAFLDQTDGDPDLEPCGDDEPENEAEPSLGSVQAINQLKWSAGSCDDLEQEHDGREPDHDDEFDPAEAGLADHDGLYEQMAYAFVGSQYWGGYG